MPRESNDKIPTSRVRRTATVGKLAATEAVKQFGTRAANTTRSEQASEEAMGRRQLETAKQIVAALGTMKGAAMKLGQVLSFIDVGLVPEEHREEFQQELAKLRDAAPTVSFKQMRKVIEEDLEAPIKEVFSAFDEEPVAAASIGQVYRATLREDGREVAVKVQYPGVAGAVRADMQNLGMIMRLMKGIAPGLDVKALTGEIRERMEEELDYELEAQNQRRIARIYEGHPFIVVPGVVGELSREHVIVSEFVQGRGFEEMKQLSQAERDRLGEIIFRFYFECMYRHRQFSGDPHPGNCILLDDGRMAFLDFGLFKTIPAEAAEFELQAQRLAIERRPEELVQHMYSGGWVGDPKYYTGEKAMAMADDMTGWYTQDREIALDPEVASDVLIQMSDPRSRHFGTMRHETLPPDHLFGRRLEVLTLAVLSQLRARANWNRIAREWIYGDEPVTELGREEAEFYGRAGVGAASSA